MKRLTLLFALCSTAFAAAPWDGTRGDLSVLTVSVNTGALLGFMFPPTTPAVSTQIFVASSDLSVCFDAAD